MILDTRSFMFAAAVILASASIALFALHKFRPTEHGPGWWALGNALGCLGMVLLGSRGHIPDIWSITLANGLIVLGFCLNFAGLRIFLGAGHFHPAVWSLPFLEMGALAWYSTVTPSHRVRLVISSLLVGLISCAMARDLLRHGQQGHDGRRLPAQMFTCVICTAYGITFLARGVVGIIFPTPDTALAPHPLTVGAYILGILLSFLSTLALFLMVSERLQEELAKQASHDHLTGIPNRRAFQMMSRHELGRAKRTFESLALLVMDLDHFKSINDRYGHAAGDAVLRDFASLLAGAVREQDIVSRYGGEEFVALLPGTTQAGALSLAERIRTLAESRPIEIAGRRIAYTVSTGLAVSTPEDAAIDMVLERADRALYRAKAEGRNRVRVMTDEDAWEPPVQEITAEEQA